RHRRRRRHRSDVGLRIRRPRPLVARRRPLHHRAHRRDLRVHLGQPRSPDELVQTNFPHEKRMEDTGADDNIGNELEYTFADLYLDNTQISYRQSNTDFDDFGHPGHAVVRQTGISDARYTFTYDESGRLIERDRDDGLDGTIDGHATIVYDEQA